MMNAIVKCNHLHTGGLQYNTVQYVYTVHRWWGACWRWRRFVHKV